MRRAWLLAALLTINLSSAVQAQIYEWIDASGSRHFTNSKNAVPADQQANMRVLIAESERIATVEPMGPPPAPRDEPRVQVVFDRADVDDAYAAGVRDALALDRPQPMPPAPSVVINGPLAVANSDAHSQGFDDAPYYYPYPLVTTSFDRGRSRHLTLRMLLQDQFQLDRDGPFFHERLPVGLGPGLHPFLPRGLPNRIPPGSRVLFR